MTATVSESAGERAIGWTEQIATGDGPSRSWHPPMPAAVAGCGDRIASERVLDVVPDDRPHASRRPVRACWLLAVAAAVVSAAPSRAAAVPLW